MKQKVLILTILLALFSCKKELLHSIQEEQANDIISLLLDYGIRAEKIADGRQDSASFNIMVEESDYSRSWNILRENGLPREKIKGLSDVYQKQGLISSSTEEKALLIQAIKGEVEKTLETIDNVIKARVIISLPGPSQNPFSDTKEPVGASVLLKVKKGSYVNRDTIKGILLGAVSSLDKERISVEIVESSVSPAGKSVRNTFIGPFMVSDSSAKMLYAILLTILSILSLLAILAVYFFFSRKVIVPKESEEF
ncbi:MAG: hypothetical protein N3B13_06275 [Deltaproteobacteria bacterium]|nr:hypothetical protein [Deltaproteobacteria bacterium]